MLDDLKYIERFDSQDALGLSMNQFEQLEHVFSLSIPQSVPIDKIVVTGMGGSALAADYVPVIWGDIRIPYFVRRDYSLPAWVDNKTLVVASSYSGNTEEVLAALGDAQSAGAQIVIISSGGRLIEIAQENNYPYLELPSGIQPRMSLFYQLKALADVLDKLRVTNGASQALEQVAPRLSDVTKSWGASTPSAQNQAKQIAEYLVGKTPVVYGGLLYPAAYKWKISFNENAKNTAWCGQYPEFNHNEFLGWSSHPVEKPFGVIDLISSFDNSQVQKRFNLSDRLLSGRRPKAYQIQAEGDTPLEQLLWTTVLGDMVSIYLAILNGVNPTPVDLIEKFKNKLKDL